MSEKSRPWDTRYEWKTVALLALGFGLVGLDRWVIADLAGAKSSSMVADLHLANPPADVGNLVAALGVTWGVSSLFMGNLSDRFGRKAVLVPALVVFSLLSALSGITGGLITMLLARSLMGLSEGAFCPTSFATVAEASEPRRRGFNLGLQQSAFALFGLGFGPIIATQLLQWMNWLWVSGIVGIPGLVIALFVALTIREPATITSKMTVAQRAAAPKFSIKGMFAHRNVALSMVALLCAMCGILVISAFIPAYLTGYLKLSDQKMGIVASAIGFGGFLGQWGLPTASDYVGRRTMAVLGFLVGAVFLVLFMRADGSNLWLLFTLLFISAGFAFGLLSLITGPIASEAAPLGMIASTAGCIIAVGEIFGGGVAPGIAGFLAGKFGIQYTLYLALAGLVVGVLVSLFYKETAPRRVGHGNAESSLDRLEEEIGGVAGA